MASERNRNKPVNSTSGKGSHEQGRNFADQVLTKRAAEAPPVRQHKMAEACAADWNAVLDSVGSFADNHSTL